MKYHKWVLEISVAENWVEDGFDFHPDRVQELSDILVPFAYSGEVKIRVLKAPDPKTILRVQGYET